MVKKKLEALKYALVQVPYELSAYLYTVNHM